MAQTQKAKKDETKPEAKPETIQGSTEHMPVRLFTVMTMFEFPVLAKDHNDARAASFAVIRSGEQPPYEHIAYETRQERDIRERWKNEPPWVSESVEYDPPEAETTTEVFLRLYTKRG